MKMYSEKGSMAPKKSMGKGRGEMGYAGKVEHMETVKKADMAKVKPMPMDRKGYDKKAWEYKY